MSPRVTNPTGEVMNSLSRAERILFLAMLLAAATLLLVGCAEGGGAAVFAGAVDTLPDGRIVVSNRAIGLDEFEVSFIVRARLGPPRT